MDQKKPAPKSTAEFRQRGVRLFARTAARSHQRQRGLPRNRAQFVTLFALVNLFPV